MDYSSVCRIVSVLDNYPSVCCTSWIIRLYATQPDKNCRFDLVVAPEPYYSLVKNVDFVEIFC